MKLIFLLLIDTTSNKNNNKTNSHNISYKKYQAF